MNYPNVQLYIDGKWRPAASGKTIPVLNPANEEHVGTVAYAEKADLDLALAAARKGFETWRKVSPYDRYRLMRKAADILRGRAGDIATLMTMEQGKPLVEAKGETLVGADVIDWFAEEARRTYGRTVPARVEGVYQFEVKEPVGPVAAFTPWNFPINQAVRKLSCAVATGCSIIIKGPEETPAACAALVDAFAQAGIPAGVVNLVFGVPAEISAYLIPHPIIRKISFTGSTAVGQRIMEKGAATMKRSFLELGGKSATIVLEDADLGFATLMGMGACFHAGQGCAIQTRMLLPRSRYEEGVEMLKGLFAAVPYGDPQRPDVIMGPVISAKQRERVLGLIEKGKAEGATLAVGGGRPSGDEFAKGWWVEPTLFTDVDNSMTIAQQEIFGPVVAVISYDDEDEAVAIANDSSYGLNGSVFTADPERGVRVARRIRTGTVEVNGCPAGFHAPFGGFKSSGIGREAGPEGFDAYVEIKSVGLPQGFVPAD